MKKALYLFVFSLMFSFLMIFMAQGQSIAASNFETKHIDNIVNTLVKEGRYLEAANYLKFIIGTVPDNQKVTLLIKLAEIQIKMMDFAEATETINQAYSMTLTAKNLNKLNLLKENLTSIKAYLKVIETSAGLADTSLKTQALEKKQISGKIPSKAKLITNSYFEMDLQQVLSDLSIETGVPILWDNTVQGQVTFEAKGMTLNALLQALLTPLGFTFTIIDDIYFVGSVNPDEVSFGLLSKTEVVTLSNIDAEAAVKLLSDYFKPYIKGYKDANVVCITGPEEINDRIRADLLKLDKPPVQVLIEVMVTEISSDALREIGIDWTLNPAVTNPKWSVSMEHPELNESNISGTYNNPNLVIGEYTLELISSLEALIKKGQATIRANPRITTINGKKADISLTTDQYFIIQTGTSQFYQYNTLQSITSGIKVELTPYVSDSGEVTIYVKPEVGDVVGSGANGLPEISKRSANTSVRVKDGETFTIGGLSLQKNNSVKKKVPILADIPLLGYAFRYEKMELKDTEIIIFITPYILKLGKIG